MPSTSRAEALTHTVRALPVRVVPCIFSTCVIEVFEAEAAELLLTNDLELVLECLPSLLVFDELLQDYMVESVSLMSLYVVDLDSIDHCRGRVKHLVLDATEVTLGKRRLPLQLLAVMAEVKFLKVRAVFGYKLLVVLRFKDIEGFVGPLLALSCWIQTFRVGACLLREGHVDFLINFEADRQW